MQELTYDLPGGVIAAVLFVYLLQRRAEVRFGRTRGADVAPMEAIDVALRLKPRLDIAADEFDLACAGLPEALATPRYDLERYYRESLEQ